MAKAVRIDCGTTNSVIAVAVTEQEAPGRSARRPSGQWVDDALRGDA
jgi:hypothetical protein